MPNVKKGRKSGHKAPHSSKLETAKAELIAFCYNDDAQFFMDQLFGYTVASDLFCTEMDDISRSNLFSFHSLAKDLMAGVFEEDRLRRKGKI